MSDATAPTEDVGKKSSLLPIILGLVLAILGGVGGYFAVTSSLPFGLLSAGEESHEEATHVTPSEPVGDIAYVSLPQLVVSLGPGSVSKHLIFRADLEVPKSKAAEVEAILPRVIDVLNSYLRALEARDIEGRSAFIEIRSQMLRRVQLVVGADRVNDLLVMEFVLN